MIDIENYGRSIAWMTRNLIALERSPDDKFIHDAVMQSFEVTFNITEEVLRKAFVAFDNDKAARYLSFREIVRLANDEGLGFTSNLHWLEYGTALETIRERFLETADLNIHAEFRSLLTRYVDELASFKSVLERKLVARA